MFSTNYDTILDNLLSRVPDTMDKREGAVIYDALAPIAAELSEVYSALNMVIDESFADSASYHYLIKRAAERGIFPAIATRAVLRGVFNIEIPIGTRFSLDDLNYIAAEKIDDFTYKMQCETEGEAGNAYLGDMIPIDFVEDLETAALTELLIPGEEMEDEEVFRNRYFSSLQSQAFGGNIEDYKEKTKEIDGVGGVKVYPVWDGGGTVKLVILNSEYEKPSDLLVGTTQEIIDPTQDSTGVGIAPIGHAVTVEGVSETAVDIEVNISYKADWDFEASKDEIEQIIDDYLAELSRGWEDTDNLIVRVSQVETRILNCAGVIDVGGAKINGIDQNLVLDKDAIPVRGGIIG